MFLSLVSDTNLVLVYSLCIRSNTYLIHIRSNLTYPAKSFNFRLTSGKNAMSQDI